MPDREQLPPDLSMEDLREQNAKRELEEISGLFGKYVKDAVEPQQLREELKKSIQEDVANQMKVVRDELRQQLKESRNEVVNAMTALGEKLKEELRDELRKGLKGRPKQEPQARAEDDGIVQATPGNEQASKLPDATGSWGPPVVEPSIWKPDPKNRWKVPFFIGAPVAVLLIVVLGAHFLFNIPDGKRPEDESPVYVTPTPNPTPDPKPKISKDPVPPEVWMAWMREAEAQLPQNNARVIESANQFTWSAQFTCWFNTATQERLYNLVVAENEGAEQFEDSLGKTFDSCVNSRYALTQNSLAVFGAQATVHKLLNLKVASTWAEWCPSRANAPPADLTTFKADGFAGGGTFNLLNDFLACTGLSSKLTIDGNSTAEEYLFTLYAALKELQRKP